MMKLSDTAFREIRENLQELEHTNPKFFFQSKLSMAILSQVIGSNRTYLNLYFAKLGTTYLHYINSRRLSYACELLKSEPKMRIRDVATEVGFMSVSSFSRVFWSTYHKKPSTYRRMMQVRSGGGDLNCEIKHGFDELTMLLKSAIAKQINDDIMRGTVVDEPYVLAYTSLQKANDGVQIVRCSLPEILQRLSVLQEQEIPKCAIVSSLRDDHNYFIVPNRMAMDEAQQ